MANPSIQLGTNSNWAVKEDKLLAYKEYNDYFFNKEFDFTRGSTATYVGRDGLIASAASGVPRIDFTNDTKGHLLLEGSRTNLITYSQDFSNGAWLKVRSSIVANNVISPDGLQTANKLNDNTDNNSHYIALNNSFSLGSYSASIFAKKGTLDYLYIWFTGFNNVFDEEKVWFNLDGGYVGTTESPIEASIEDYGNGWYRCTAKSTADVAATGRIAFAISNNDNVSSYSGSGSDNIYLWGAQVEAGDYSTSLINTTGAASTRNADVCNNSGSAQDFNSEEGVLYVESAALANDGTNRWAAAISDGTNFERVQIIYLSTDNTISASVINNNTSQCSFSYSSGVATDFNKIAISYKQNDFKMYVNGTQVDSDTSGNVPSGLDTLGLERPTGVSQFYGKVRNVQVFTEALTDAELQELTS